jgi:hypothetical protein
MEKFQAARKKVEEEAKKAGGHKEAKIILEQGATAKRRKEALESFYKEKDPEMLTKMGLNTALAKWEGRLEAFDAYLQEKYESNPGLANIRAPAVEEEELTDEENMKKEAEETAKKEAEKKAKNTGEETAAEAKARAKETDEEREMRESMEAGQADENVLLKFGNEEEGFDPDEAAEEEEDPLIDGLRQVQYPAMEFVRMVSVGNQYPTDQSSPNFTFVAPVQVDATGARSGSSVNSSELNGSVTFNGMSPRPPVSTSTSRNRSTGGRTGRQRTAQAGTLALPLQPTALAEPHLKRGRQYIAIKLVGLLKHTCVGLRRPTYDAYGSLRHFVLSEGLARSSKWLNNAAKKASSGTAGKTADEQAFKLLPVIENIDDNAVRKLALTALSKRYAIDKGVLKQLADPQLLDLLNAELDKPWRGFLWRNGIGGSDRLAEGDTLGMLIEFDERPGKVTRPLPKTAKPAFQFPQEAKLDPLGGAGMVLQMNALEAALPEFDENGEEKADTGDPAAAGTEQDIQEFDTSEVTASCATISFFKNGRPLGLTVRNALGGAKRTGAAGFALVVTNCPASAPAPPALSFLASAAAATAGGTAAPTIGLGGEKLASSGGGDIADDKNDEDDGIESRKEPRTGLEEQEKTMRLRRKQRQRKYYHVVEGRWVGHIVVALDELDGVGKDRDDAGNQTMPNHSGRIWVRREGETNFSKTCVPAGVMHMHKHQLAPVVTNGTTPRSPYIGGAEPPPELTATEAAYTSCYAADGISATAPLPGANGTGIAGGATAAAGSTTARAPRARRTAAATSTVLSNASRSKNRNTAMTLAKTTTSEPPTGALMQGALVPQTTMGTATTTKKATLTPPRQSFDLLEDAGKGQATFEKVIPETCPDLVLSRWLPDGESIDFYLSQAWADNAPYSDGPKGSVGVMAGGGREKRLVLQEVSQRFERVHGRKPRFWIDRFCSQYEGCGWRGAVRAAEFTPIAITGSDNVLVLFTDSYTARHRCLWECFLVAALSPPRLANKRIYLEDSTGVGGAGQKQHAHPFAAKQAAKRAAEAAAAKARAKAMEAAGGAAEGDPRKHRPHPTMHLIDLSSNPGTRGSLALLVARLLYSWLTCSTRGSLALQWAPSCAAQTHSHVSACYAVTDVCTPTARWSVAGDAFDDRVHQSSQDPALNCTGHGADR